MNKDLSTECLSIQTSFKNILLIFFKLLWFFLTFFSIFSWWFFPPFKLVWPFSLFFFALVSPVTHAENSVALMHQVCYQSYYARHPWISWCNHTAMSDIFSIMHTFSSLGWKQELQNQTGLVSPVMCTENSIALMCPVWSKSYYARHHWTS